MAIDGNRFGDGRREPDHESAGINAVDLAVDVGLGLAHDQAIAVVLDLPAQRGPDGGCCATVGRQSSMKPGKRQVVTPAAVISTWHIGVDPYFSDPNERPN